MAIKADRVTGESLALRLYNSRAVAMTETIILKGVQMMATKSERMLEELARKHNRTSKGGDK